MKAHLRYKYFSKVNIRHTGYDYSVIAFVEPVRRTLNVIERNAPQCSVFTHILRRMGDHNHDHAVLLRKPLKRPYGPSNVVAGSAKLLLGADEKAVAWYRRSIESNGNYSLSHFHLAAALAHLGRLDEARAEVQAGLALDPKLTLRRFRSGLASDNATFLVQRERLYDSLRNAGIPEE